MSLQANTIHELNRKPSVWVMSTTSAQKNSKTTKNYIIMCIHKIMSSHIAFIAEKEHFYPVTVNFDCQI